MTVKDYLNQIQSNKEKIRQLNIIKENIHIDYTGISGLDYSGDKVQASGHNTLEEKGWELLEDIQKIDAEIKKRIELNTHIALEIQRMEADDYKYSTILFERYYIGKTLADVAKDMFLDYKYVCQLHGKALRQFANQYLNTTSTFTITTNHD